MKNSSKELLQIERNNLSLSLAESSLLVCRDDSNKLRRKPNTEEKPLTSPLPSSHVLGKVKDFLGVIAEANQSLQNKAKDNPEDYDIECLKGDESKYIEMDLMLGVADLQTPEAVAAAEAAMAGNESVIALPDESSSSDSDESSEDEDDETIDMEASEVDGGEDTKKKLPVEFRMSNEQKDGSPGDKAGNLQKRKRSKIVELP